MPEPRRRYPGRDRVVSRDTVRDLLFDAANGRKLAPWCERPVEVSLMGLPSFLDIGVGDDRKQPGKIGVACRKCDGCLRHRSKLWTSRAIDELFMARRTWFVTLTVSPAERFRLSMLAEKRFLRASSETLADCSEKDRFRYIWWALSGEITKFVKRVRKGKDTIRILCVAERHKDGFPHAHLLVHERGDPITKSAIQAAWRLGFSQCKLVDDGPRAAWYVAKYLSKDSLSRVRASVRYGQGKNAYITEKIIEICDTVGDLRQTEEWDFSKGGLENPSL